MLLLTATVTNKHIPILTFSAQHYNYLHHNKNKHMVGT